MAATSMMFRGAAGPAAPLRNSALDSTVSELDEKYSSAKILRRMFEQQWLLNIAYYLGQQWVRVDGAGMLFNVGIDDRVTLTDNRIRPAVRTAIAKQTKQRPEWVGVPRDASDDEVVRARMRQITFEHYWRELQMRRKVRMWLWWREMCGMGFIKTVWDRSAGESMTVIARQGAVVLDSYGRPITPDRVRAAVPEVLRAGLHEKQISFGDVQTYARSPFEIAVDPLATSEGLISAEYIVEEALYSPAYLERTFGADRDQLQEHSSPSPGPLEARFPALTKYMDADRGSAGRRGVKVREYWSLPGTDGSGLPGRHAVWTANGQLLVDEPNPYPFLPYSAIAAAPSGRFWTDAPVNDYISPQTELNKTESQIAENAERFGNPARLRSAESSSQLPEWEGLPGEEILYHDLGTPGSVPSFLTPPEMPGYVQARIPQIIDAINSATGQQEIAQGTVPQGVTAASAISQLMEANDTQAGPDIDELSDGLTDVGKKLLWCLSTFATDERLARIGGDDGAWEVYTFRGSSDLGPPTADEVDVGPGLSQSKAQKQAAIQFILNLLIQNGQPLPPRELRRVLRDYEVGGLEHFFASTGRDQSQVLDEHRRMLAGETVEVNSFDDDQIHVEEHNDFRKGSRYQTLRNQPNGPQIMAIFEAHVQAHTDKLQAAANNQAAAEMAMTAAKTGSPGPDPAQVGAAAGGGTPPQALPSPAGAAPSPTPGG